MNEKPRNRAGRSSHAHGTQRDCVLMSQLSTTTMNWQHNTKARTRADWNAHPHTQLPNIPKEKKNTHTHTHTTTTGHTKT